MFMVFYAVVVKFVKNKKDIFISHEAKMHMNTPNEYELYIVEVHISKQVGLPYSE